MNPEQEGKEVPTAKAQICKVAGDEMSRCKCHLIYLLHTNCANYCVLCTFIEENLLTG